MSDAADLGFLYGAGVCGALARDLDWAKTPLGPIASWSQTLKTIVAIVLHSRAPMLLHWGPEQALIYNDACLPSFRQGRHPAAMGKPARDGFPEAWPVVGPDVESAMRGAPVMRDDALIPIVRDGRFEEAYWSYAENPVFEPHGGVSGVLGMFCETTFRVIAERRIRVLRAMAERLADVPVAGEVIATAMDVLRSARVDVPFAIVFRIGTDGAMTAREAALDDGQALPKIETSLRAHLDGTGAIEACVTLPPVEVRGAPWPEPVDRACILEVPSLSSARSRTLLLFGLSPRLSFDDRYEGYLTHIVAAIEHACARIASFEARASAGSEHRSLLMQAPVATILMTGPEHQIELANRAFIELSGRELVGKKYLEAFPELAETELPIILDRVYRTGEPFGTKEQLVPLKRNGVIEDRWFSFNLQPMRDSAGDVYGVIGVSHEITESVVGRRSLERLSAEREKLLSALEAANRSKDEFLAMLGHELRNPLAPITTALHLMALKEPGALVRERAIIERQAGHLVHLVDDLLDVSRVTRGKVRLNKSRIALADVVSRAVETATPLFEQKRHTLTVDVPSAGLDVDGDPVRLGQVFSNLLTNAAKYTEPGGRISVRATREDDAAVVRVEDNGAGIHPDQLAQIFDAFVQGPRASDRALGGLGLGLALVKSFVTLHGGAVVAHSRGPGFGSVFEVRLPALAPEDHAVPEEAPEQIDGRPPPPRKRVLLVDDSEDILELVSTLLRFEGYEVLEARDGPSALQVAPSFRPDVAVLDIGLPAMDGYDLAQHLREELGESTPKLIAMTGYGQESDRERARQAGFAVHLVKPVDPSALLASIRS